MDRSCGKDPKGMPLDLDSIMEPSEERTNEIAIISLERRLRVLGLLCAFVIFVILSTVVAVAVHLKHSSDSTGDFGRSPYTICLPCENLTLSSPVENEYMKTISREGSNRHICCASNSTETSTMMERFYERKLRIEKARGKLCNGLLVHLPNASMCTVPERGRWVAAHVVGDGQGVGSVNTPMLWRHKQGLSYTYSVEYRAENGRLVIPDDGVYFIYSQIYFVESPPGGNIQLDVREQTLIHTIMRGNIYYNNGEILQDEILLKTSQTKCWAKNRTLLEYSSYLGGALTLRAQDEIYVENTAANLVDPNPHLTFFGLYKTHA